MKIINRIVCHAILSAKIVFRISTVTRLYCIAGIAKQVNIYIMVNVMNVQRRDVQIVNLMELKFHV